MNRALYLKNYLNSDIGKKIIKLAYFNSDSKLALKKNDIEEMFIALPSIYTQNEIVDNISINTFNNL